jgi:hypothetical protein
MRMYGERDERIATHLCKRLLMYARADRLWRVLPLCVTLKVILSSAFEFRPVGGELIGRRGMRWWRVSAG